MNIPDSEAAICATCGAQYEPGADPDRCMICEDERQYVPPGGQTWTSIAELSRMGHRNIVDDLDEHILAIHTEPRFGIGQRSILVQTSHGNLLWDCLPFVDESTVEHIRAGGGVDAIAVSHPHFYSSMVTWSKALGDVPIHIPESSRRWLVRTSPNIRFWDGSHVELWPGVSLHRTGGHFDCSQVALWSDGADGRGTLFTGDEPMVNPGLDSVSFMFSFPNGIPLNADKRRQVHAVLQRLPFDRLYSGWPGREILTDAKQIIRDSAARYDRLTGGDGHLRGERG